MLYEEQLIAIGKQNSDVTVQLYYAARLLNKQKNRPQEATLVCNSFLFSLHERKKKFTDFSIVFQLPVAAIITQTRRL